MEPLEPRHQYIEIILCSAVVRVLTVFWLVQWIASGESNTGWLINVEDVSLLIPWENVSDEFLFSVWQDVWTGLKQPSDH